jgi:hypothetical protein
MRATRAGSRPDAGTPGVTPAVPRPLGAAPRAELRAPDAPVIAPVRPAAW